MRHTVALALAAAVLATAAGAAPQRPPVITIRAAGFGDVLARPDRQALYFWTAEKPGFKVRCTGACARAWPPLIARSRAAVPRRIAGIRGTFGVVRRPDGRLQVTHNRLPLYTYAHERPGQVLCDDVDGWFVVRI